MKKRAVVFIDGFNLYYGLRYFGGKYKWLDVQALANSFLQNSDTELAQVKYFTANVKGASDMRFRQKQYLDALEQHCDKLTIYYGHYLYKDRRCTFCNRVTQIPEEKKTDVNIACEMLRGAYEEQFDLAYLVSGDSDLVPPVQIATGLGKTVIIAHPPRRKSTELCEAATSWFAISHKKLRQAQLPQIIGANRRPAKW